MDSVTVKLPEIHEYVVHENHQQKYTFLVDSSSAVSHMRLRFYVERDATLVVQIVVANVSARINIDCILRGRGANARIEGAYVLSDEHVVSIDTFQHHQAAHTSSTLVMKGALRDKAHAQFHGTIRVDQEASGTYALQENKNILLSNDARALSVPNLEVLTNDVHCFHGSAIGRFDSEQLFYAASRGIDEKAAHRLLLAAFFADLFVGDELGGKLLELIG